MKNQIIHKTFNDLKKQLGEESLCILGLKEINKIETFSSGSLLIDYLVGIGGFPKGRIIEIYGPEASGKTTFALQAIKQMQSLNGLCAFIDAEHAFDVQYAKNLGVDLSTLIFAQPDSGEKALEIAEVLIQNQNLDLIVVDSVAALVPEAELEGQMNDTTIGLQARLMSKALRKITSVLAKNKTTIIFINQLRDKIATFFASSETTPGGRALKFYASIRIEVRKTSLIQKEQKISGINVKIKIVKNKLAPPYQVGQTEIHFNGGTNLIKELISLALIKNIIMQKGPYYKKDDKILAKGKNELEQMLINDNQLFIEIKNSIFK